MAKQSKSQLRDWFRTGKYPTQQQFWDLFDSFFHKDEKIPISTVENLQTELDEKASATTVDASIKDILDKLKNVGGSKSIVIPGPGETSFCFYESVKFEEFKKTDEVDSVIFKIAESTYAGNAIVGVVLAANTNMEITVNLKAGHASGSAVLKFNKS